MTLTAVSVLEFEGTGLRDLALDLDLDLGGDIGLLFACTGLDVTGRDVFKFPSIFPALITFL